MNNPFLKKRVKAYKEFANSEWGKEVLKDLAVFCYVGRDSFNSDAMIMANNEGKRSVFNRIMMYANLDINKIKEIVDND